MNKHNLQNRGAPTKIAVLPSSSVSFVNFEQVNAGWVLAREKSKKKLILS